MHTGMDKYTLRCICNVYVYLCVQEFRQVKIIITECICFSILLSRNEQVATASNQQGSINLLEITTQVSRQIFKTTFTNFLMQNTATK